MVTHIDIPPLCNTKYQIYCIRTFLFRKQKSLTRPDKRIDALFLFQHPICYHFLYTRALCNSGKLFITLSRRCLFGGGIMALPNKRLEAARLQRRWSDDVASQHAG